MDTAIIVAIISSGLLSTIITGIFGVIKNHFYKNDSTTKALRQLLYDRIKEKAKEYIARGSIADEELQDLMADHQIYHSDLGGNGYLDELMNSVKKLPLVVK